MNNGSSARLDRIEKIIETMVRAQRDRDEATAKAQRDRDEAMAKAQRQRDEAMAKAQRESESRQRENESRQRENESRQRESEIRWEKRHLLHDCEISRIDAQLSRFVKLGVREALNHRKRMHALDEKIKQLTASQLITEEKLQRFISSLGTNGYGTRT